MIIGDWAIKIGVNAGGLVAGLGDAGKRILGFGGMVSNLGKTIGSGLNSAIAGISRINLGAQTAQLQGLASGILGVGAAVVAGGPVAIVGAVAMLTMSMVGMASASMDAIALQARLGRQLGITASEAGGLQIVAQRAGLDADGLSDGLNKWSFRLSDLRAEVARGSGPMTTALQSLGINAATFANARLPDQMVMIAEGAQKINDPMERMGVIGEVLGPRLAVSFGGIFRQPAADFRNLTGIAEQFGVAIDDSTAGGIAGMLKKLQDVGRMIGSVFGIVGRSLAVVLAPLALLIGDTIGGLIRDAKPLIEIIGVSIAGAFAAILIPVALVTAGVRLLTPVIGWIAKGFTIVKDAVVVTAMQIWNALAPVGEAIIDVFSIFSGPNPFDAWRDGILLAAQLIGVVIRGLGLVFLALAGQVISTMKTVAATMVLAASITPMGEGKLNQLRQFEDRMTAAATSIQTAQTALLNLNATPGANGGPAAGPQIGTQTQSATEAAKVAAMLEEINKKNREIGMTEQDRLIYAAQQANATNDQLARLREAQALQANLNLIADINKATDAAQEQLATLGMTARQLETHKLMAQGATSEMLAGLSAAREQLAVAQARANVEQQVAGIIERNRTPLEQFQEGLGNIQEILGSAGGEGLDRTQQAREVARLFDSLDRNFMTTIREAPGALQQGSVEAARAVAAARREAMGRQEDPQERAAAMLEQLRDADRRRAARETRLLELAEEGFFGVAG